VVHSDQVHTMVNKTKSYLAVVTLAILSNP
jgi:hypothetical protein